MRTGRRVKGPRWDAHETWEFRLRGEDGTIYVAEHPCVDGPDAQQEAQGCAEAMGLELVSCTPGKRGLQAGERPLREHRRYADYDAD